MTLGFTDDIHVDRIAKALWSKAPIGSATVLVGAGFSRNATSARSGAATMPSWSDLYRELVDQLYPQGRTGTAAQRKWLIDQTGATSAFLRIAEEYKAQFGRDALDAMIVRSVPDEEFEPGDLHSQLLQLPWSDILTTNWDTLLERSARTLEDRVYDIVCTAEDIPASRAPRIVKLHGSLPSQRPFIFTEEDFRTYPDRFAPFLNLARQSAMETTLVLLGFSGEDPNFLYWTGWVRDQLGRHAPLIYLVGALDLSSSRRKMLESQRIQPVELARLPQFASWPESQRIALANRWFLERLRAAEPYRPQRWPRPKGSFSPALQLVDPEPDLQSPLAEPAYEGSDLTKDALAALTHHWARNRRSYPGWVLPPRATSDYVWGHLRHRLWNIIRSIQALPIEERVEPLFELDWQLNIAAVPLALTIDDYVEEVLAHFMETAAIGDPPFSEMLTALALSLLRHAREEGNEDLFTRLSAWLAPRLSEDRDKQERLLYERCLFLRARGDIDALEQIVSGWHEVGDPFWLVRKAGLLADLGRDEDAGSTALEALVAIRQRTRRGEQDIASWSRESLAMLFRWSFLHGQIGNWEEHKGDRDRFDERQDLLSSRGCPFRSDFFSLREELDADPPPLKKQIERTSRFDVGAFNTKFHLAGEDPRATRLRAYRALRFQEESGLPARISHVDVMGKALERSAIWLADVAPHRALDALFRDLPSKGEHLERVVSRDGIARLDSAQADDLMARLLKMAHFAIERCDGTISAVGYWTDRLGSAIELISRVVVRVPGRASDAIGLALAIFSKPNLSRRSRVGDQLENLLQRSIDFVPRGDLSTLVLQLMSLPIQASAEVSFHDYVDPGRILYDRNLELERTADWADPIERIFAAAMVRSQRPAAIQRLETLWGWKFLTDMERERFGEVLWADTFLRDGLPWTDFYLPIAFVSRPYPTGIDPRQVIADVLLSDPVVTDGSLRTGALESIVTSRDFAMSKSQVEKLLKSFADYVAAHNPKPDHPFAVFERGTQLVAEASDLFASLCRRCLDHKGIQQIASRIAGSARYPLRIEPALPALVRMGAIDVDEALELAKRLLDSSEPEAMRLRERFLFELLELGPMPGKFENAVWVELQFRLVSRSRALPQLLRVISHLLRQSPDRLTKGLEESIDFVLRLLVDETDPTADGAELAYDRFAARYWAAAVLGHLDELGRASPDLVALWRSACENDPLPEAAQGLARGRRTAIAD